MRNFILICVCLTALSATSARGEIVNADFETGDLEGWPDQVGSVFVESINGSFRAVVRAEFNPNAQFGLTSYLQSSSFTLAAPARIVFDLSQHVRTADDSFDSIAATTFSVMDLTKPIFNWPSQHFSTLPYSPAIYTYDNQAIQFLAANRFPGEHILPFGRYSFLLPAGNFAIGALALIYPGDSESEPSISEMAFDDIRFEEVPEPSTLVLGLVGLAVVGIAARRRDRR